MKYSHTLFISYLSFFAYAYFCRKSTQNEKPSGLPGYLFCLWAILILIAKSHLSHYQISSSMKMDAHDWIWLAASLATFVSLIGLSGRFLPLFFWLFNAAVSTLFWVDILFDRYFDDVPGSYMLNGLGQGGAAAPSAWALREASDLLLFVDLPITLLAGIFIAYRWKIQTRIAPATCCTWLVGLSVFHTIGILRLDSDQRRMFRLRFRNTAVVEDIGLFNYHLYDLIQMGQSHWSSLIDSSYDKAFLDKTIQDSRQSMQQHGLSAPGAGCAKGCNLLVIQLESLESFVLNLKVQGEEITPFINQLSKSCLHGAMQDQTGQGRSSDGEFIYNNSLLPPGERPLVYAYPDNHYHGLPGCLADAGYYTLYTVPYWGSFWNCRYMSGQYGFQHHMLRDEYSAAEPGEKIGWGLSDRAIFKRVIPKLKTLKQPFYTYVVTMMGHHPYEELQPSEEPIHFKGKLSGTMLSRYLNLCRLRDSHVKDIVASLKKSGLWDNTLVVMMGDHDARIPNDEMALISPDGIFDEVTKCEQDKALLLIHTPKENFKGELPKDTVQVDFAPTLVHLLGIDGSKTCFFGRSLLSRPANSDGLRVSKGGYAINSEEVVIVEGNELVGYSRKNHAKLEKSQIKSDTERWYHFIYDFLRLDLLPTVK